MSRIDHIRQFIEGKRVLDVGGVGHHIEKHNRKQWLHKQMVDIAAYVLGTDYLEEEVKKAQELGYNFTYANAEALDEHVKEHFDVCVAGELIEHLANPGLFLNSAKRVLVDGGVLILTTPNAFAFGNIFRIVKYALRMPVAPDNFEHKMWYDLFTLEQFLNSQGFDIVELRTIRPDREVGILGKLKRVLYGNAQTKLFCVAKKN